MKLKEKLGDKYSQLEELLKDTGLKPSDIDLIDGYVPRSRLNEVTDKLKASEDKSNTLLQQIEENQKLLEKSEKFKEESEQFKTQVNELSEKHKLELESRDKELKNVVKRSLVKEKLIESGAKHVNLLMKEIDLDEINLDNDKLIGFDEKAEKLKNDYKDMFTVTENQQNINLGEGGNNDPFEGDGDFSFLDNIKS